MKVRTLTLAALLACAYHGAAAQTWIGAEYAQAEHDYPFIDASSGGRIVASIRRPGSPLAFELSYIQTDGGDWSIPPPNTLATSFSGFEGLLSFGVPLSPGSASRFWAGLGFYSGDTRVEGAIEDDQGQLRRGSAEESARGLEYGFGLDLAATQRVAVRLEYRVLADVDDFLFDEDMPVLGAGILFAIGGDAAPAVTRPAEPPSSPPEPEPAPVPPPAPVVLPAAPEPEPAPIAATPTQPAAMEEPAPAMPALAPGQRVRVSGGILRIRPQASAATRPVSADSVVELKGSTRNAEGEWWYVGGAASGWALASEIEPAP